ncbi:uncharacterized protein LOC122319655 [Drosophila yakuba]|uniref:RNase H type-1 domain-containing protein n=1 Tax=Drosophila yakuba TaxID=7245 RepID=A0A0R1DU93_DROYA|nr:uncharacterized protein LOC122319655 [Drosophila yakuba]KRJ98752.1 uncharacterized protein Dyak_GE28446 [Drosophila yakuba]
MAGGVGSGIYCTDPEMRVSYKLPSQCSIFQAEVFAIGKAAELALSIDRPHEAVNLFVDSQAAIRSMPSSTVSSKSVLASRQALDILSTTTSVRIYWVPSHQDIDGNETADELAKEGVGLANERSENVPVSLRTLQSELERRPTHEPKADGKELPPPAKIMCKERNVKLIHYVLHLPRKDCRMLVGILTGHCLAAAHAVKLGITYNARCRKCDEFEAICKCPTLSKARINYLGAPVLASVEDASKKKPGELLLFAKTTSILKDFEIRENIL